MYTQGEWVFKTDKLTPLQVKACVCQQCPFPGELETKCDWCDNPKMMEFLRVAISAMEDFYTQENKIDGNALPSAAYDEYFTPPQGEGGLLSDEEICKTVCGEYAGKCPARKLNHGCSDFVDIMAVITKQHAIDQQHETNALKEQDIFNRSWKQHSIEVEEEAIELFNAIREGSYKPDSYTTQPLEINVKALKAELESE